MNTRLVAVDADGSVLFGGDRCERLLTGFGAGVVSPLADGLVPDRVSRIPELDTVVGCRLLARNEAIVAGASSGAVVQAFLQAAPDLAAGARVVLVLHDGGAPYLDYTDTVLGQVYEGMDVVDTIAQAAVDENQKPTETITINSVSIETYQAQ